MESPRIAAEEAWESEVAPESEMAPASEAALEPAESEVAPASQESEAAPEPTEERPSMLSRLASWRAPEPEPETAQTEEVHPGAGGEGNGVQSRVRIRLLECLEKSEVIGRVTALPDPGRYDCRAPPGRLGLAFKDATCVVGRVNATSALFDTVRKGDELVSVNDCVVADDYVIGVLTAQDDGATARALVFSRYDCKIWADTGIGFESTPDFAFFSAPTGGLFVAMAPGRPVQGDRRHSQPAGPFSHLIGSVEYFSPISDAARRRDGVKDAAIHACAVVLGVLCMAMCVVCGGGGGGGRYR